MRKTALVSARLCFRPLRLGDEKITFRHIDDELTKHWIDWEKPKTIEEEGQRLASIIGRSPSAYFLAFDRASNFVGMCGLLPEQPECVELGVDVWVVREVQGQGYGFEMVEALASWAVVNTRKEYLVYSVTEGNEASRKIAERMSLSKLKIFSANKRGAERSVTNFKIPL